MKEGDEALLLSVSVGQKGFCHCHKYFSTHQLLPTRTPYIQTMLRQNPYLGDIEHKVIPLDWFMSCIPIVLLIISFLGWDGWGLTTGYGSPDLQLLSCYTSSRNLLHVWQVSGYLEICPRANICETSWLSDALGGTGGSVEVSRCIIWWQLIVTYLARWHSPRGSFPPLS